MHFTTAFTSLLLTSVVLASPVASVPAADALVSRDLCQVGVPCVVQYEVNTALTAVTQAVVIVQADIKAVAAPTGPVIVALNVAASALVEVAAKLQVDISVLVGDAKLQLEAYVVAAISALIVQIRAGVAIITGVSAGATVTVSAEVTAAASAVLTFIAAIEAVVGPCPPPSS